MDFLRVVLKPIVTWQHICKGPHRIDVWEWYLTSPLWLDFPYVETWRSADEQSTITFCQDPLREVRYFHLAGTALEPHEEIIRGILATYTQDEIVQLVSAARSPAEQVVAVYHAAVSATPVPDPAILGFLTRAMTTPEFIVRRAAIDATLVALWSDLREPLERVAGSEPDAELREFAGETLERLRTYAWDATPGRFDFAPLPPDRRRITPLTDIGAKWYEDAHGVDEPKRRAPDSDAPPPKLSTRK